MTRAKSCRPKTGRPSKQTARGGKPRRFLWQWLIPAGVVLVFVVIFLVMAYREPPELPVHINLEQRVVGPPTATVEQARRWAEKRGGTETFCALSDLYWELAPQYGVNPVVAYAQAGMETRYGNFGGVIDASYHNPCGLKTAAGGEDADPAAHQRFATWEEGVRAQLEHLCLYAGVEGYPLASPLDPRHFPDLLGRAGTVGEIGRFWASSDHYAELLAELINRMEVQYVHGQTTVTKSGAVD